MRKKENRKVNQNTTNVLISCKVFFFGGKNGNNETSLGRRMER